MADQFPVRFELAGHTQPVTDLDWSPDGELLATCSRDGTIRVVRVPRGRERAPELLWTAAHQDEVLALRFSHDGERLASGGRDCRVHCWDTRTGAQVNSFFGPASFGRVAWSADDHYVSGAQTRMVHIFEPAHDGATFDRLEHETAWVSSTSWLPDGSLLTGDESGALRQWNIEPRKSRRFAVPGNGILDLAVGKSQVAIACRDGVLRRWSLRPLKALPAGDDLKVGHDAVRQVVFFLDDRILASISDGGWVTVYEHATRAQVSDLQRPGVARIAAHPRRSIAAVAGDEIVRVVDVLLTLGSAGREGLPSNGEVARDIRVPGRRPAGAITPEIRVVGGADAASLQLAGTDLAPTRILFLAANPSEASRLLLDQEAAQIGEALQGAARQFVFHFDPRPAVRTDSLQRLLQEPPTAAIVHFSGHGTSDGSLLLVDRDNRQRVVHAEQFAEACRLAGPRLVVLNACFSDRLADLLIPHVDAVIGMDTAVADVSACAFSKAFYESLGQGKDVRTAFDSATNYIAMNGLLGREIPRLVLRGR